MMFWSISFVQVAELIQFLIENTPAVFGDDLESLFNSRIISEQETRDSAGNRVVIHFGPSYTDTWKTIEVIFRQQLAFLTVLFHSTPTHISAAQAQVMFIEYSYGVMPSSKSELRKKNYKDPTNIL